MKMTSKVAGLCLASSLLVAMAVVLVIQHHALNRVQQEKRLLQQQVDGISAQADRLTEEKERLSKLITAQPAQADSPLAQEQFGELLRLRGEVGRLRFQDRDAGQSRRDQMQVAQAKLANAEVEFARLTKLHSENLVSPGEFSQAKFALELLKAEAKGDTVEAAQLRLRQAEEELARAAELRSQSLISQTEYDEAARKVESLKMTNGAKIKF